MFNELQERWPLLLALLVVGKGNTIQFFKSGLLIHSNESSNPHLNFADQALVMQIEKKNLIKKHYKKTS